MRPSQLALASLIAVAIIVLFGAMGPDQTVSGTFTGSQPPEQVSPGVDAPTTSAESPMAVSEPPSMEEMTAEPQPSQVTSPDNWGVDAPSAPMRSESASGSADTTAPPTTAVDVPPVVRFASCAQAKAAGVSMIPSDDPRYAPKLDRDGDGVACDRRGDPPTRRKPPPTVPDCVPRK